MTVRIAGVNIPDNKQAPYSLSYIYGIGIPLAFRILKDANISPDKKISELNAQEINRIKDIIEKNYRVEGALRREIQMNIKRLKDIHSYRGLRHIKGLPARGQRTKTNARTRKGKRKTVGSGRRKAEKK